MRQPHHLDTLIVYYIIFTPFERRCNGATKVEKEQYPLTVRDTEMIEI